MSSTTCTYSDRDESIIAYVYDELGASERDLFARHLRGCVECRDEVAQFAGVRRQLAAWTPPALESFVASSSQPRSVSERNARSTPDARSSGWWAVPAWAQVAAAMLCLGMGTGVGAGLADLRITYGTQGLTIATGRSMARVRTMLHDSEQRQQRELALRVAEVARDVQAQRQADLVRIDRTLGVLQNNTGLAVRRQEQLLNSLAVRVSQRQE